MIIATILDESGSMSSIKESTISGFNEFLQERKRDIDTNEKVLTKFVKIIFNSTVKKHEYSNIDDVERLNDENYKPSGMTALYDAIGIGLDCIKDNTNDEIWFIIITDGLENRSMLYEKTYIKEMIQKYKKYNNWNFIFCGANQDSYLSSRDIGMDANDTVVNFTADPVSVGQLYRGISRHVSGQGFEEEPVRTAISEQLRPVSTARPRLIRYDTGTQINI